MDEIKVYVGVRTYIFIYKNGNHTQTGSHDYNIVFNEDSYDVNELYVKRCKTRNKIMIKENGLGPYTNKLMSLMPTFFSSSQP